MANAEPLESRRQSVSGSSVASRRQSSSTNNNHSNSNSRRRFSYPMSNYKRYSYVEQNYPIIKRREYEKMIPIKSRFKHDKVYRDFSEEIASIQLDAQCDCEEETEMKKKLSHPGGEQKTQVNYPKRTVKQKGMRIGDSEQSLDGIEEDF